MQILKVDFVLPVEYMPCLVGVVVRQPKLQPTHEVINHLNELFTKEVIDYENRSIADLVPSHAALRQFTHQESQFAGNAPDITICSNSMSRRLNFLVLLTDGFGRMYFVLTFYDTPIASSTGLSDVSLPRIVKVGCDA